MAATFQKAQRKRAKLRLGISGVSGSGKTYSALLVAYGLTSDWERVALIDTERHSGELYADLGGYSVCEIDAPFTPQKYIEAINAAEQAGFGAIIIDSLTHAWTADGGMLDMADKLAASGKNSFTAWRDVTPWHNKLVDTLLQSTAHIIVTVRAKTEYVLEEDSKGKKVPRKVGLAPQFRDGLEYEMTTFFDISDKHFATTTKDRTKLFDSAMPFIPSVETGKQFVAWLNLGTEEKQLTAEEAAMVTTPKGKPLGELTKEQLETVINGAYQKHVIDAAKVVIATK